MRPGLTINQAACMTTLGALVALAAAHEHSLIDLFATHYGAMSIDDLCSVIFTALANAFVCSIPILVTALFAGHVLLRAGGVTHIPLSFAVPLAMNALATAAVMVFLWIALKGLPQWSAVGLLAAWLTTSVAPMAWLYFLTRPNKDEAPLVGSFKLLTLIAPALLSDLIFAAVMVWARSYPGIAIGADPNGPPIAAFLAAMAAPWLPGIAALLRHSHPTGPTAPAPPTRVSRSLLFALWILFFLVAGHWVTMWMMEGRVIIMQERLFALEGDLLSDHPLEVFALFPVAIHAGGSFLAAYLIAKAAAGVPSLAKPVPSSPVATPAATPVAPATPDPAP